MTKTLVATPDPDEPQPAVSIATFDFHGHRAAVLTDHRGHWVFPGQLCAFMGIAPGPQRRTIERNHWSEGWRTVMVLQLPTDTQAREHFLLHQRRLATWLGSITTSRIKDSAVRSRVEQHQTEFADALADYLTKGVAINPRAAQRAGDDLDVIEGMVRAIRADRQRLTAIEQAHAVTAAKVAAIEGRHDEFTALGYAKLHDHPTGRPYLSRVGKLATTIMRGQGQEPHVRQDATFGTVNVYPVSVLARAFAEVPR